MARTAQYSARVDLVTFGACILLSLVAMVLPANLRDPVASSLRRSLVAPLIQLQRNSEAWRAAYLRSQRDELRRDTLALAAARVPTLETDNDHLRKLLGLGSDLKWGFIPAEALHGRGRAEDFTLILSAGSNVGVQAGSLVVAPEGLVGVVQTVDPTMSLAILFAHPDFRVSAMSADGSAFGIVQPHIGTVGSPREQAFMRSERYLLEMRGVPFRATMKPGAVVFSSGLGGVYPKGIPIGVVFGDVRTTEAWARTYLIRPAVNPADVTSVMILTPQRTAAGLANVWANVAPIDSATKSIVAAGDSLARSSATAEAAARRASIDSAARLMADSIRKDSTLRAGGVPLDTVALAKFKRDSILAARARRARRDSLAAIRKADSLRRDSSVVRP